MHHRKLQGWRYLGPAVYGRKTKTGEVRAHTGGGLVRMASGCYVSVYDPNQYKRLSRFVKIQGDNRRRGVLMWAESLI